MEMQWWKRACDANPHAIAFVANDDLFTYVNQAWCRLCGWSSSELVGRKRWQEVTAHHDVGADQTEGDTLRDGEKEEYYITKRYVTPTGREVSVGLYVHRHPPFGAQQGFIVFAVPLDSREQESMRQAFSELQTSVTILQEQQFGFAEVLTRLGRLEEDQRRAAEKFDKLVVAFMGKPGEGITITSGNETVGRDKQSAALVACMLLTVVMVVAMALGTKLYVDATLQQPAVSVAIEEVAK